MNIQTADFTADLYTLNVVDTSSGDINVTLPDCSQCPSDSSVGFVNIGTNRIVYITAEGQNIDGVTDYVNNSKHKSDCLFTDTNNWYRF